MTWWCNTILLEKWYKTYKGTTLEIGESCSALNPEKETANHRIHARCANIFSSIRKVCVAWQNRRSDEHLVAFLVDDGSQQIQRCRTVSVTNTSMTSEDEADTTHDSSTKVSHAPPSPSSREMSGAVWSETPKCLGCARYGRQHNAACKKRKVMFDNEMRDSFYNSAKRGQLDGVVAPHEDPEERVLLKFNTEQPRHSIEFNNIFDDSGSNKISKPFPDTSVDHNDDEHDTTEYATAEREEASHS